MSVDHSAIEIDYPESDGKPMGETDLHRNWMVRIIDILQHRYRGQQVYVSGDLLLYYEEGNPKKFFVPDVFVVLDCPPGLRRTFKVWEEGKVPSTIFEVTSRSTKREDQGRKPQAFARIGVPEYFLYDPTSDYLDPPVRGFRLSGREYVPIEPDDTGALVSEQLQIAMRLEGDQLALYDQASGERLLMEAEAERAAFERERAASKRERAAFERESAARQAAEAELQRLRKLLDERGDS